MNHDHSHNPDHANSPRGAAMAVPSGQGSRIERLSWMADLKKGLKHGVLERLSAAFIGQFHRYQTQLAIYNLNVCRNGLAVLGKNKSLKELLFAVSLCFCFYSHAQELPSLLVEELTHQEVQSAQLRGYKTLIIYAGSTEQNGPHMVTGKHNVIARYVAEQVAKTLGNALIYPILPYAPTGGVTPPSAHMRFAGSVSLTNDTYKAVLTDLVASAYATGFTTILLIADHGDGQTVLRDVATHMNNAVNKSPQANDKKGGGRVLYIGNAYTESFESAKKLLQSKGIPVTDHAGVVDTSELLFIAGKQGRTKELLRLNQFKNASPSTGSDGGAENATEDLGRQFIELKVKAALAQIKLLKSGL